MHAISLLAFLRFETPGYLALLAVIPLLVALSIRSLSGLGRGRKLLAILARSLVITCMVLALAGAHRTQTNDKLSVIFLVDSSHSIPQDSQKSAFQFLQQADKGRRVDDRVAVVTFDGASSIQQLPMSAFGIKWLGEPVRPDQTNIAAALRMGMALFPPDTARRVVIISDGNENVGDGLGEADQFRAAKVPIDVLPVTYQHTNEVIFEQLKAPPTANSDETVNLRMVLRSLQRTKGKILLYHGDELLKLGKGNDAGFPVELEPGPNAYTIQVPLRVAGAHRFRAVFQPDNPADDTMAANNEGRAFTIVSGQGRILILTTDDDLPSAQLLKAALESEKLVCDLEIAGAKPLDQVRLLEYSLVILSNVPRNYVSDATQNDLALYVRDLGGGLIMLGGSDSFGAGGWMDSAIEEVMPVTFDVKSQKQIPKGALVLAMHACEIPQGNYWGERVAVSAVKTLSSRDLIGVLSYQPGFWAVPLRTVGDKGEVVRLITQMQMGDMPSLEDIMRKGVDALVARKDAVVKHMIVISDFDPSGPSGGLLDDMKKNGISCSTVAIGYGGHWIDEGKAKSIADNSAPGGKFYKTDDYSQLPQIFIKESRLVRRSLLNEIQFSPRLTNTLATTVAGLAGEGIPDLYGYVLATPKQLADVPLIRKSEEGDDPILAHWQVGLGKTVAFTSGMWRQWGADWTKWPKFSKLWAQIARWASRQSEEAAFDVSTTVQGGKGKIRIDALDKNAAAINFMTIQGRLIAPGAQGAEAKTLRLTQTGPGRYEAEFDARDAGSYIFNLAYRMGAGKEAKSGALQTGLSVAYSPEYRDQEANLALLNELRNRTNGRQLDAANPEAAFDWKSLPKVETKQPIWEDLIRYMLALFLIDVAIRRIAVHPVEIARKVRRFIADMAGRRQTGEASAAVLTTLKGTRDRTREETETAAKPKKPADEAGTPPARSARYEAPPSAEKAAEDLAKALGGATESDKPVVARPTGKKPPTTEADYTSRLLKAKRKARDELNKDEENKQ